MAPGNMKSEFVGLQRNKTVNKSALSRKALARIGDNVSELLSGNSSPIVAVNMAMVEGRGGGCGDANSNSTVASQSKVPPAIMEDEDNHHRHHHNHHGNGPSNATGAAVTTTTRHGTKKTGNNTTTTPGLTTAAPAASSTDHQQHGGGDLDDFQSTRSSDDPEGKFVEKHEVQHLKALSMLHLDVIEQQQNELQRRDQELQKVRAQNDTLKARLERIQRRTVLAQKHQEPILNHVHIPASVSSGDSSLTCKRKGSSVEPTTPIKRQPIEKDSTPSRSPAHSSPYAATGRRKQLKAKGPERGTPRSKEVRTSGRSKEDSKSERSLRKEERTPRKEGQGSKAKEDKKGGAGDAERSGVKGEQYLKTEVIYPCLSDVRVTDPDPALPEGQTVVQVPSWRVNIMTSCSGADIAEDLEEGTFERRHQKYEIAEQKRKRWDIQRVRELREHERLEQKMLRREYGNWDDVLKTFYPEPYDACQLQVSETIPLVAFGVQVPVAKDLGFELPWYDVNERDKEESRRQTRSRTNRR